MMHIGSGFLIKYVYTEKVYIIILGVRVSVVDIGHGVIGSYGHRFIGLLGYSVIRLWGWG